MGSESLGRFCSIYKPYVVTVDVDARRGSRKIHCIHEVIVEDQIQGMIGGSPGASKKAGRMARLFATGLPTFFLGERNPRPKFTFSWLKLRFSIASALEPGGSHTSADADVMLPWVPRCPMPKQLLAAIQLFCVLKRNYSVMEGLCLLF